MYKCSFSLIAFLGLLLFTSACSSDPQRKGPEETAKAFLQALQFGDYDKAATFCSEGTAKNLTLMKTMNQIGVNPLREEFEITSVKEDGDYATVYYDQGDKTGKLLQLRKDNNRWLVLASKGDFSDDNSSKNSDANFRYEDEEDDDDADFDDESTNENEKSMNEAQEVEAPATKYEHFRRDKSAKATAELFLKALHFQQFDAAKRYGSKSTNDMLDFQAGMKGLSDKNEARGEFTVLRVKEDGEYAKAYYQEEGKKGEKVLKLGKDDLGNWEVIMSKSEMSEKEDE